MRRDETSKVLAEDAIGYAASARCAADKTAGSAVFVAAVHVAEASIRIGFSVCTWWQGNVILLHRSSMRVFRALEEGHSKENEETIVRRLQDERNPSIA